MMLLFTMASAVAAPIHVDTADALWAALEAAAPGDEVVVAAGTYETGGYRHVLLYGTEAAPIVVRAADGATVVIQGVPDQNTVDIGGSWYQWRGFEMTGGSHGLRIETTEHAVFEDLHIHDVYGVGISMNRPHQTYSDVVIRGLHIHDTGGDAGECMYLGCNDDGCQVSGALIEGNWCHDTTPTGQGDGIELKTGSYDNIVRNNVIHGTNYPGITMYGTRGRGQNIVEGNVVWDSGDNGIQVVGDVIVRNNLVWDVAGTGITSKPSQDETPHDLQIVHNTVLDAGDACFKSSDWGAGTTDTVVANNVFLCPGGIAMNLVGGAGAATVTHNAVSGDYSSSDGLVEVHGASVLADPAGRDLYPVAHSALVGGASLDWAGDQDFDCVERDGAPDLGAYELTKVGALWTVTSDFKGSCLDDEDGGTTGDGGASDGGATDGGVEDGGATDGGATDGGATDGGATDGGATDGGATDGGVEDGDAATKDSAEGCGCAAPAGRLGGGLALLSVIGGGWRRRRK